MTPNIDLIIARIRAFAQTQSNLAVARRAGITHTTICDMFSDTWNPRISTIRKLERAIPPDFKPAGDQPPGAL